MSSPAVNRIIAGHFFSHSDFQGYLCSETLKHAGELAVGSKG